MDDIELGVCRELNAVVRDAEEEAWMWNRGKWTSSIKSRLCHFAKNIDPKSGVCARDCVGADFGEWLYDFCWYVETRAGLATVRMAMECEWSPDGGNDPDFQKLLQSRAEHRVWIFEAKTPELIATAVNECRSAIANFGATQRGDRYLFAGVAWNPRQFHFSNYVHA